MVTTNNEELYQRLKLFHTHGITREEPLLTHNEGPWYYEQLELGYNYRITDIQCALGISQMKRLDQFAAHRRKLAHRYDEAFAGCKDIVTPYQHPDCLSSYHLYMIQVPAEHIREIFENLRNKGIGVNVHYIPVYKLPYYQQHGYQGTCCPNAEAFYAKAITLPLYADMTEEQVDYVVECVKDGVEKVR